MTKIFTFALLLLLAGCQEKRTTTVTREVENLDKCGRRVTKTEKRQIQEKGHAGDDVHEVDKTYTRTYKDGEGHGTTVTTKSHKVEKHK